MRETFDNPRLDEELQLLTDREWDCLCFVVERYSSKEIALRLGVSPKTVDSYLSSAKTKLGARTRFEAAEALVSRFGQISHGNRSRVTPPSIPPLLSPTDQRGLDVDQLTTANLEARIRHAQCRRDRETRFLKVFPPVEPDPSNCLPPIAWPQLERQLRNMAGPNLEGIEAELEILRASARINPPEMFYRDLLTLAWSLIDGTMAPSFGEDAEMD